MFREELITESASYRLVRRCYGCVLASRTFGLAERVVRCMVNAARQMAGSSESRGMFLNFLSAIREHIGSFILTFIVSVLLWRLFLGMVMKWLK